MERFLIITLGILYSCLASAHSSYQIDLIVFAQPKQKQVITVDAPLIPTSAHALALKVDADKSAKPYHLLSPSLSSLRDEYYLLSHKSDYKVLGYYSWRQTANNQSRVALPLAEHNGWQMQGTLNITQGNYYSFAAELQVSPPSNPQSSFIVSQKQRMKDNVVYYLDNAQIGMLVKIHKLQQG